MKTKLLLLVLLSLPAVLRAQDNFVKESDVTWIGLGVDENSSMPLGNGDIALNVWTEKSGDIVLLLAKADAWSENGQMMKLGRVRVKLTPNPFAGSEPVEQILQLETGDVLIRSGKNSARIWVDANHPVARVEVNCEQPVQVEAKAEIWRTKQYHLSPKAVGAAGFFEMGGNPDGLTFEPDTVLKAQSNTLAWYHYNTHSFYPTVFEHEHLQALLAKYPDPLLHRAFGVAMKGTGLTSADDKTLQSAAPVRSTRIDLYALTKQVDDPAAWHDAVTSEITTTEQTAADAARTAHEKWWTDFWNRSWVHVAGAGNASKVSQSYAIQRFMTACAGRGAQPIKFNGSLFTVGHDLPEGTTSTEKNHDPDYRSWGASFWNQNVRLSYWPLIKTGDYDLMQPWFNMYVNAVPLAKDRAETYFHHAGGAFIETIYFWGLPNLGDFGWNNKGVELQSTWMKYHIQGAVEVIAMMLDRYDNTLDADFAGKTILPLADATVTFYDQHYKRDGAGKILMSPSQSLETYQVNAVNPTPDIAGLMNILPRLLALPGSVGDAAQRATWKKVLADLPPIPMGTTAKGKLPRRLPGDADGNPIILPAQSFGQTKNTENPQLYTVFPYRLYGVGKPDLKLAVDTYKSRLFPFAKCWGQDGAQAADLGLTDEARRVVTTEFTSYGNQRFGWFWSKNNDWIPDVDNGGSGMTALQEMLMQCDGKRIQLIPAWPSDWTADFKLNAPFKTTVEGHVENGKVTNLKVSPPEREKDVVVVQQ